MITMRKRDRSHLSIDEVELLQDLLEISTLINHDLAAFLSNVHMEELFSRTYVGLYIPSTS